MSVVSLCGTGTAETWLRRRAEKNSATVAMLAMECWKKVQRRGDGRGHQLRSLERPLICQIKVSRDVLFTASLVNLACNISRRGWSVGLLGRLKQFVCRRVTMVGFGQHRV